MQNIIKFGENNFENNILGIVEDNLHRLWINTEKEILIYNPDSSSNNQIFRIKGIEENYYSRSSFCKTENNKIFFGGYNGINVIESPVFETNKVIPPVVFSDFKVANKTYIISKNKLDKENVYLPKEINFLNEVRLKYYQNHLFFSFVALNYISQQNNEYSYILEGFDKEWSSQGIKREAKYNNLNPGKYIFRVKACNSDGVWNNKGKSILIIIKPPFWQTWFFRIMVFIIICIALASYYLIKTRNIRIQNIKLSKLVKERTYEIEKKSYELNKANKNLTILNATKDKFFSIIAHDLRNPFMGIINFSEILVRDFNKINEQKKIEFLRLINKSSRGAYNLLENLLTWAMNQTGRVEYNSSIIDLSVVVNESITVLKLNAEKKNITIISTVEKNTIVYADLQMVRTIIRNILNPTCKIL